eukprot:11467536-Prorocentrum_lima.AAC.1
MLAGGSSDLDCAWKVAFKGKIHFPGGMTATSSVSFTEGFQLVSSPTPFRRERPRNSSKETTKDAAI